MLTAFQDAKLDRSELPYAGGFEMKECLGGTRERILEDIDNWIDPQVEDKTYGDQRGFLLVGQAGTGKSSIMGSVASKYRSKRQLGSAYFFCDKRGFDKLIPTIARDLADRYPSFRERLAEVVSDDTELRHSTDIAFQFENLIKKPLSGLDLPGPITIVLDALDESAEQASPQGSRPSTRNVLLSFLRRNMRLFPSYFRFIITSRPELDVLEVLGGCPELIAIRRMDELSNTNDDISIYVTDQLRGPDGETLLGDFTEKDVNSIVRLSEGLFQFASLCCSEIRTYRRGSLLRTPRKRLDNIISSVPTSSGGKKRYFLDALYLTVLKDIFGDPEGDLQDEVELNEIFTRFRKVMGLILATGEPLTVRVLAKLATWDEDSGDENITTIIQNMGSLLTGLDDPSRPIQPYHSSFRDFLLTKSRSKHFAIDYVGVHQELALTSFELLSELRFNMYNFRSSYLRNTKVELAPIPEELSYACRFWSLHLGMVDDPSSKAMLMAKVEEFLEQKFLFWLEVLSALRCINIGPRALSMISSNVEVYIFILFSL
jgi:hypothetical protein